MTTGDSTPFRMITVGLLVIVIVMALVFAMNAMDREVTTREHVAEAEGEVQAVSLLLDQGDLPEAIIALHDVGMRLHPVEGAEAAARRLSGAVADLLAARDADRREVARARQAVEGIRARLAETEGKFTFLLDRAREASEIRDRNALAVRNLLAGRVELARRVLEGAKEPDVVARALLDLLGEVTRWNHAARLAGAARVEALEALARSWPLTGIAVIGRDLGEVHRRFVAARRALEGARERLDSGDTDGARQAISTALGQFGLSSATELFAKLVRRELMHRVEDCRDRGDFRNAAAGLRILGDEKGAAELEAQESLRQLTTELLRLSQEEAARGRPSLAAGFLEAAAQVSGDPKLEEEVRRAWFRAHLARAEEHLKGGRIEAALDEFRQAGPELRGQVADLEQAVKKKRRVDALVDARAALDRGEGKAALEILAGLEGEDREQAELRSRAELLAGDPAKGLAGLPEDPEVRTARLLVAGYQVLGKDAARAARLGLLAVGTTGPRPGALGLLAAALRVAGDKATDPVFEEAKKALFDAAALPGEK